MSLAVLDTLLRTSYQEYQQAQSQAIKTVESPACIFDLFFKKCLQYHNEPVHNLQEMRAIKSTKAKGDLFEFFCVRYLQALKGYDKVWRLSELTDELKVQLKLPRGRQDYGIDLVALKGSDYSAVQCKFKAPRSPIKVKNAKGETKTIYPCVNWRELSTFNELCNASGPWAKRITMTTATSVRRLGGIKNSADLSICLQSFKGLSPENWLKLIDGSSTASSSSSAPAFTTTLPISATGSIPIPASVSALSQEDLRAKRMAFYQRQST